MTGQEPEAITRQQAESKAAECREMAKASDVQEHRVMLEHMAETWQRIADGLKREH